MLIIGNMIALSVVLSGDASRAENVMGQILNAASRTNGLLAITVVNLSIIAGVLMLRR